MHTHKIEDKMKPQGERLGRVGGGGGGEDKWNEGDKSLYPCVQLLGLPFQHNEQQVTVHLLLWLDEMWHLSKANSRYSAANGGKDKDIIYRHACVHCMQVGCHGNSKSSGVLYS